MKRRFAWILFPALLVLTSLVVAADDPPAADQPEPPVLLKKKQKAPLEDPDKKPPAADDKPKPPDKVKIDDDPDEDPDEPEIDEKEVLARIAKNLRTAEDRLANKEVGEPTQQVQRDILKDLDTLIEMSKRPQSNDAANADPSQQNPQQQQNNQQASSKRRNQQNQLTRNPNQGQDQKQGQRNQPQNTAQANAGNNPGAGGKSPQEENKLADLYKDIWGHLPESMRGEMDAYSREAFMAKYSELIKQYYATVAEKSRQKDR